MITELEGLSWYASTTAFKLKTPLEPEQFIPEMRKAWPTLEIQALDGSFVAGHDHLVFAAHNAVRALKAQAMISRSLSVEMLLYSTAQRQISKAIELMGLKKSSRTLALLAAAPSKEELQGFEQEVDSRIPGERDDGLIEASSTDKAREISRLFGIRRKEIQAVRRRDESAWDALKKLVVERVALLVVRT